METISSAEFVGAEVAAILRAFMLAEVSAATLQPIFELGARLNPDLQSGAVCAWCGVLIRGGTRPMSHGICDPCAERAFNER